MINPSEMLHWKNFTGTVFVSNLDISKEELIEQGYPNFIEIQMEDGAVIRYWIDACVDKAHKTKRIYKLRNCPFCNEKAKIIPGYIKGCYEIDCEHNEDCPLYLAEPDVYHSKDKLVKVWNGEINSETDH